MTYDTVGLCKPHSFEVFSELHQCIHCGMRIVDHQRIEKLEKRLADLQELYDDLVGCHEDAVHRFVKAEKSLWPDEPCGRSLEQCPYDKQAHQAYFDAQK